MDIVFLMVQKMDHKIFSEVFQPILKYFKPITNVVMMCNLKGFSDEI